MITTPNNRYKDNSNLPPLAVQKARVKADPVLRNLKTGVWLYFFLLLFEGALRKWFLPALATPLLIVRDPIAVWLVYKAMQKGYLQLNGYITGMWLVGVVSFLMTMLMGHQNIMVALFGLRILVLHFPLMFIIGRVLTPKDVIKIGKTLIYISLPMIVLIAMQFYSPQSAWVNRGVGGDLEGAGFSGAMGFFRPPGIFSFINGNVMFWSLTAVFIFYFWLYSKQMNKLVLLAATLALIVSIPLSISRTLLFDVGLTLLFTLFILMQKPGKAGSIIIATVLILMSVLVLSQTSFFQTGTTAFTERFTSANETEGGLVKGVFLDRFLGGMVGAITNDQELPFFGHGLGMGTNAGSMLITGKTTFLIAEVEWGRLIGEMGILLGMLVILIRTAFVVEISIRSFKNLRTGNVLPWLLLSFGALIIVQGQWAQPTALGFSTLIGGLILATLKVEKRRDKSQIKSKI